VPQHFNQCVPSKILGSGQLTALMLVGPQQLLANYHGRRKWEMNQLGNMTFVATAPPMQYAR
jgi:hypothetical protein